MTLYGSQKNIEIVVNDAHLPYISDGYELYLVFYEEGFLRRLLFHILSNILVKAQSNSEIEQTLILECEGHRPLILNEMHQKKKLDSLAKTKMNMKFQFKYKCIPSMMEMADADALYFAQISKNGGTFTKTFEPNDVILQELILPCHGALFVNIIRSSTLIPDYMSHYPFSVNELLHFAKMISKFKFVIVSASWSLFMENIKTYLTDWRAEVDCIISKNEYEILHDLAEIDRQCYMENPDPHVNHVLLTDDLSIVGPFLKQSVVIAFFSIEF